MANKRNINIEQMAAAFEKMGESGMAEELREAYYNAPEWKVRAVRKLFHLNYGVWSDGECSDVVYQYLVHDVVTVSELSFGMGLAGILYWATESNGHGSEEEAIKRFEKDNPDKKVYHVVSNPDPYQEGDCYTLLFVFKDLTKEKEPYETLYDYTEDYNKFFKRNFKQVYRVEAYVTGNIPCSDDEFGSVAVTSMGGGLIRVA